MLLIEKWAWGLMTLPTVQSVAAAAVKDQAQGNLLRKISRIGARGALPGHLHRDMVRLLRKHGRALKVSPRPLRLWLQNGQVPFWTTTSIIMPHELLASIYSDRPAAFEEVMLGGSSDCIGKFWADFPPPACLANDGRHDFRQRCIPVAVHGDGVAISQVARTGSKKVDCISWQSLLCKKQTALSSFLIFFAFAHQVKEEGCFRTWWSVWRHICWSLRALYSGKWPSTDQDGLAWPQGSTAGKLAGQDLAGGFYCIPVAARGDIEWMSLHHGLAHPSSRQPCSLCLASNAPEACHHG